MQTQRLETKEGSHTLALSSGDGEVKDKKETKAQASMFGLPTQLELKDLEERLSCPISGMPFSRVKQSVTCKHVYDQDQIDSWLKQSETCPVPLCDQEIRLEDLVHVPMLSNLLNQLGISNSQCSTVDLSQAVSKLWNSIKDNRGRVYD